MNLLSKKRDRGTEDVVQLPDVPVLVEVLLAVDDWLSVAAALCDVDVVLALPADSIFIACSCCRAGNRSKCCLKSRHNWSINSQLSQSIVTTTNAWKLC